MQQKNSVASSKPSIQKSIIQEVDHNSIKYQNENLLQVPLQLYKTYGRITELSLLEEITKHMSQIDFLKKNCPEGTKLEEFTTSTCSYFKYEKFTHGEIVFNYGEYGDKVYLILQGEVGVFVQRSPEEIKADKEVIEVYKANNTIPNKEINLDYETIFKKKKTPQQLASDYLLTQGQNHFKLQNMYFKDGVCQFKRVFQFYSGQVFGDMALTSDKPRTASIVVLTGELHLLSMSRQDFKQIGERSIKEKNQTYEYFQRIFAGIGKFIVAKFIQYFQKVEFAPQTILWKEGDEPKFFFLIIHGYVQLYKSFKEEELHKRQTKNYYSTSLFNLDHKPKKKLILSQLSDNAFVGEAELLEESHIRKYSCMTTEITTAYYMEIDSFNIVKKSNPDFLRVLREKSQMLQTHLESREGSIISNLKKQDEEIEQLSYKCSNNTERIYVNDLFLNSNSKQRSIRSKETIILSSSDIAKQNQHFGSLSTARSGANQNDENWATKMYKSKSRKKTSNHNQIQINPHVLNKLSLRNQLIQGYKKMQYNRFKAEREVSLKITSTTEPSQQQSSLIDTSLKNSYKGSQRIKTQQDLPMLFVTNSLIQK